ncbi:bifunctional serine/threonine-protein kinase/formylglycine-generating enzyme family protein [Fimbriiglobus ruber]|uniref:Protein kinase domain-containing protein n=1 Tax=Fimbriiglobus ruber TaxID=1908690 RepID=A0A225DAJ2_9BACT|nr:bifunctional serine/threonine-protein kinase/formylglycine-generating enzyme family protein [Fimbriiglobus ruber]OWK38600.1 protein of unknown function DUF323 [Fimbriiglobus ruber]
MNYRNLLVNLGLVVGNMAARWEPSGIASKLLEAYGKHREKQQLKDELEALLRARFVDYRAQVEDAMGELRLKLSEGVRVQVEAYLSQFQASAKQAARLLGDPSATTVPATVGVDDPQQLAAFLPQRPPRFTVGDAVPGLPSWTLVEPLGAGGFGEVWKARHEDDDTFAAFKFIIDPAARERFTTSEARVLKEIHQKAPTDGVVKLLLAEPRQDPPWLQFEYVDGGDLSRLPEAWKGLPAAERVTRVRAVVHRLATTASHFHTLGVVHRDLKPSNVLLRADDSLVIADFGISKIIPASSVMPTPTNASLATIRAYTPIYASPQQKRHEPADRRDDVYALGVLWYQLLRGDLSLERPSGDGWKRVLAKLGVSEQEVALLNRCWDDEPDERPGDGSALAAELAEQPQAQRAVHAETPVVELRVVAPHRDADGSGLRWRLAAIVLLLCLCVAVILATDRIYLIPDIPDNPSQNKVTAPKRPDPDKETTGSGKTEQPTPSISPPVTSGKETLASQKPPLLDCTGPNGADAETVRAAQKAWAKYLGETSHEKSFPLDKDGQVMIDMVLVPPGKYYRGEGAEAKVITLSHPLWVGKYEVTQQQYEAVMGTNPSTFKKTGAEAALYPVESVSHDDAVALSTRTSRDTGGTYRLLSEAEWEYAYRAGTRTKFYNGNSDDTVGDIAQYEKNNTTSQAKVGSKKPNGFGLYDMAGNCWEWCSDWYEAYDATTVDPRGPESGSSRVYRGGSWNNSAEDCRAAYRNRFTPPNVRSILGFRLARVPSGSK